MYRHRLLSLATGFLIAASLAWPSPMAWGHGGGGGGHGGGGGGHGGGGHGAGHFGGASFAGHAHGGHHPGFYGLGLGGLGLGYGGFGYGYWPYGWNYGGYGYGRYRSSASSYGSSASHGDPYGFGSWPYQGRSISGYQAPAYTNQAVVHLVVPEDAQVWFNDVKMEQVGTQREFESPVLEPGKSYCYQVRARWLEDGKVVERSRALSVQANGYTVLDLTRP